MSLQPVQLSNTICDHVTAEVHKTLKEMDLAIQRLERQKENLQQKLSQTEKDLQLALKQEQQAHEEDVERLSKERVCISLLLLPWLFLSFLLH